MALGRRGGARRMAGALGVGLVVLTSAALALVGCGSGVPSAVPTVAGGFVVPQPVRPSGAGMVRPMDCIARGGDRVAQMACMLPYLETMLSQVYGPVVTQRGVGFEPPTIAYPTTSVETACGALKRPGYCPTDHTLVLPLRSVARTADAGAAFLLKDRPYWARDPAMARYLEVPVDVLRSGGPMSVVIALAHEYAHHVEAVLGSVDHVAQLAEGDRGNAAKYSSALELGADCLAGWSLRVGSMGKAEKSQEFGVLALLTAIGDDYGAVASGRAAADDDSAFEHGSMQERHDAFTFGFSLADTSQDPYLGCRERLIEQLRARGSGSGTSAPSTTTLGLAAAEDMADTVGQTPVADDAVGAAGPVEPDVPADDDPVDGPVDDPPGATADDDPSADAVDEPLTTSAPTPVTGTDEGDRDSSPTAADPRVPIAEAELEALTDSSVHVVADSIAAVVAQHGYRVAATPADRIEPPDGTVTPADRETAVDDADPLVTADPLDTTDGDDPDADDDVAALFAVDGDLYASLFGAAPDELGPSSDDDPNARSTNDLADEITQLLADSDSDDPTSLLAADPTADTVPAALPANPGSTPTNDVLTNVRPTGAVLDVHVDLKVGAPAAGSTITVAGAGLKASSAVRVLVYSEVRVVAEADAGERGDVVLTAQIPSGLEPGPHTIDVRATGPDGEPVQTIGMFEIDQEDVIAAYAEPGQTTTILQPGDPELQRALHAGRPIFDPARFPTMTASIAVAGVAVVGLAGLAGLTSGLAQSGGGMLGGAAGGAAGGATGGGGFPAGGGSPAGGGNSGGGNSSGPTARGSGKAKLKSVSTKKLDVMDGEGSGRGDRSRTWRWPGTEAVDRWLASTANTVGRYSLMAPRLLVDGAWSRAMFGSMSLAVWAAGLLLGIAAAQSVGFGPYPPALPLLLAIVMLGIMDAVAGMLAWLALVVGSVVTGQMAGWADLRTLLGLFVLYAALPLIAHAIRPMRREYEPTAMARFDRVSDYIVMPLLVAFAAGAMYKALNGLSGLELVSLDDVAALSIGMVLALWGRLAAEDVALHAYPLRSRATEPDVSTKPSRPLALISVGLRTGVFILVAAPFFGLGRVTLLAAVLMAVPMMLKVWRDDLPNFPRLNKYTPRGLLRFTVLLVSGLLLSAWLLGQDASDDQVMQTHNVLLIPGIALGVLAVFGRKGGDWPDSWRKEAAGAAVFVVTAAIVTGVVSIG